MIVDDQDFIRSLLRHILGVLGCTGISDAASGEAAWFAIRDNPPDLLIVDWEMEPMDGIELVKKVRHDETSPDRFMPIIMITAHSERPRIIAARDAGVNEFVMKPVSAKTLFSRLNAVIEHPRRFVRAGEYFGPDRRRKRMFVDFERRDTKKKEKAIDVADVDKQMSQDEVNKFLNPDDQDSEAGQAEASGVAAKTVS
ncbi:MAG: response regulator [Rhodospirillales bacterium]|nr:response regulator [Alphaproteobacteria bacterium]MBL6947154.1 response regulator [Rhodospirillales bacterium]